MVAWAERESLYVSLLKKFVRAADKGMQTARAFHHPERIVTVRAIRDAFNETIPDRAVLAAATGWSRSVIDTIDLYEKSDAIYIFATTETLAEAAREFFGDVGIASSGSYPFAGQCPLIVFRKPLRR